MSLPIMVATNPKSTTPPRRPRNMMTMSLTSLTRLLILTIEVVIGD